MTPPAGIPFQPQLADRARRVLCNALRRLSGIFHPAVGTAALILAAVIGGGKILWDASSAHAFAGVSARIAGYREKGQPAQALALIHSEAWRFPGSKYASGLDAIEDSLVREMIEAGRHGLRDAAVLEGTRRVGDLFRLYGELVRTTQIPVVYTHAEKARAQITARREAAEEILILARDLENRGDLGAAAEACLRVLREHAGSSAARDLKIPLYVETVPAGALVEVVGLEKVVAPDWVRWPMRPGAVLRVDAPGFRAQMRSALISEDGGGDLRLSMDLEPESVWKQPFAGGLIAGGDLDREAIAVVIGADRILRGLRLQSLAKKGRIAWEIPLDPAFGAKEGGAFVLGDRVFLASPGKPCVLHLDSGSEAPADDPPSRFFRKAMEGLPPSNWARRAGAYRGALFTLADDGILRRWDMEKAEPSFTVPCGDGISRLTTLPRSLVLTGPGGRVAVRDPDSGAQRGPVRSIGLAAGEEVEDLIPETDFPDGGFIIRARRSGDEEIFASDAQGRLRWRFRAGSPLPISMRPVSLPNGRKAVLLSAQAWGVRLMRCP